MLVVRMEERSLSLDMARVCEALEKQGCRGRMVPHTEGVCIVSEEPGEGTGSIAVLPGVRQVVCTGNSFPLGSRAMAPQGETMELTPNLHIGGGSPVVMAGPCAVEGREQMLEAARGVKAAGASMLRGGAFKPRTNPYSFQGLGHEGVALMAEARRETGLPIITEVMGIEDIEGMLPHVDMFQVGARNMQNFSLLKALGRCRIPVLLKRGMTATVDEWLQAAEYILAGGNHRVVLCERGIRSFEKRTRNTLDLSVVPLVKSLSHLPVIVDPSHGTGVRDLVLPMSLAALSCGADGLMIEVHPRPSEALSDGAQSLDIPAFENLMQKVNQLAPALGALTEEKTCPLKIAM